jgi:hypothetical protein
MRGAATTTVSLDPGTAALLGPLKDRGYKSLTVVLASVTFDPALREMLTSVLALGAEARTELLRETLTTLGLPTDMLPPSTQVALPKRPVGRPRSPAPPGEQERKKLQAVEMSILRLLSKHGGELSRDCRSALNTDLSNLRLVLASLPM